MTMVVYVGTEEGSCLRAVDTAVVVDVVDVADGGGCAVVQDKLDDFFDQQFGPFDREQGGFHHMLLGAWVHFFLFF